MRVDQLVIMLIVVQEDTNMLNKIHGLWTKDISERLDILNESCGTYRSIHISVVKSQTKPELI